MTGSPARGDDLLWWALGASLPSGSSNIGTDRAIRVLVALAMHADAQGLAWPSAQTLANRLTGLHRRDVRNALDALSAAGLIERADGAARRRSATWRLLAPTVDLAGIPATGHQRDAAGDLAGHVAGHLAGIPATNRKELKPQGLDNASTDARTCTRHATWNHTERCRACMSDREAHEQRQAAKRPATMSEAVSDCGPGSHRFLPDGTCMLCPVRREAAA